MYLHGALHLHLYSFQMQYKKRLPPTPSLSRLEMRQSLFAHVHAFQSRKVSGLKLAPIATFSSIGRFRLPFLVAVLFMLTHCYLLTCKARSREDLLRPSARRSPIIRRRPRRWFASKCARHDRSRRGRRAGLFFCLSLSLPAARRRRR